MSSLPLHTLVFNQIWLFWLSCDEPLKTIFSLICLHFFFFLLAQTTLLTTVPSFSILHSTMSPWKSSFSLFQSQFQRQVSEKSKSSVKILVSVLSFYGNFLCSRLCCVGFKPFWGTLVASWRPRHLAGCLQHISCMQQQKAMKIGTRAQNEKISTQSFKLKESQKGW